MKRILSATGAILFCSQGFSSPVYHPPGPNLTYGSVSNSQTIMSEITNPAAGAAALAKDGGGVRFGVLSNIGAGFELGDVDDMYDRLDEVTNNFDSNFNNITDPNIANLVQDQIDTANQLLLEVEDNGYGKAFASLHIPLMPIVLSGDWLGGSWVFDASVSGVAKVSVFADPLSFDAAAAQADIDAGILSGSPFSQTYGDITVNFNGTSATYDIAQNDSSFVGRIAGIVEAAVGYSTQISQAAGGKIFAGLRGKYYKVALYQNFEKFDNNTTTQTGQDFLDGLDTDNGEKSTGFGLDFGLLWVSDHFRVGGMITNINEPEFEYNNIDTSNYDPVNAAIINKFASNKYIMERQATIEAALHSQNQNWVISGSLDLNEVMDPIGDEYQWMAISAAYATDSWWLPGIRAGYRVNQAGSELKYLTGGVTVFKSLNLDIAYSPDKVEDENGNEITRSFIINLGLELTF